MKTIQNILWACNGVFFVYIVLLAISHNTQAQTITNATQDIENAIQQGHDPWGNGQDLGVCQEAAFKSGNKALCRINEPYGNFILIGCQNNANNNCSGNHGLRGEYDILQHLDLQIVASVNVGPNFIDALPCYDVEGVCGGFVEARLGGVELKAAHVVQPAVNAANQGNNQNCANGAGNLYGQVANIVNNSNAFAPVRNLNQGQNNQARGITFMNNFNVISHFAFHQHGINDLQGFVQNQNGGDGSFIVFDPEGAINDDVPRRCFVQWTCAIAAAMAVRLNQQAPSCMGL